MPPEDAAPAAAESPAEPTADQIFQEGRAAFEASFDDEAEPEATETDEPAKPKPVAKAKPKPDAAGSELEQLRALAKKHGFEVEDGKVSAVERIKFKGWKADQEKALDAKVKEALADLESKKGQSAARLAKAEAIEKAHADGDWVGLAKALGHEDWNALQKSVIARVSDPNYLKTRELEEWKNKKEREEAERAEKEQAQKQQAEQQERRRAYIAEVSSIMSKSKDKLAAVFHDDALVVNAILRIQQENYDRATGRTVTPEQALKMKGRGTQRTLTDELKTMYDKLHSVFGSAAPETNGKPKPNGKIVTKTDNIPSGSVDASSEEKLPFELDKAVKVLMGELRHAKDDDDDN